MWILLALIAAASVAMVALALNAVIFPNSELLAELDQNVVVSNVWDGAKVHLYKVQVPLSPTMVIGDFTEADFTGYTASSAVVCGTAFINPFGIPTIAGASKSFASTSPFTIGNTVYGWYLTDTAGTTLIAARQFDQPIIISGAFQGFDVLPAIPAYLTQ